MTGDGRKERRSTPRLSIAAAVLLACQATVAAAPIPLRKIVQIRNLSVADADRHLPVRIRGVVTLYDRKDKLLFVQDRTGGIFVEVDRGLPISKGSLVEVAAVTVADYTNTLSQATVREIGRVGLPAPRAALFRDIARGNEDCNLVSLTGVVRSAAIGENAGEQLIFLKITTLTGDIDAQLADFGALRPAQLIDATVRVTAVAGAYFNDLNEFLGPLLRIPSRQELVILKAPPPDPFSAPLRPISQLLRYREAGDFDSRVRVAGTVTLSETGEMLAIQNADNALLISCRQCGEAKLGDEVEIVGFPALGSYRPTLDSAQLRVNRHGPELAPKPLDMSAALSGRYSNVLVTVKASLAGLSQDAEKVTLDLSAGGALFTAKYETVNDRGPPLKIGSRLQVTGICMMQQGGFWKEPVRFALILRSPRDIVVLAAPNWWTPDHVVYVLAGAGGLMLLVFAWVTSLKRRVAMQGEQILLGAKLQHDRSEVLELISGLKPMPVVVAAVERLIRNQLPGVTCAVSLGSLHPRSKTAAPGAASEWTWPVVSSAKQNLGSIDLSATTRLKTRARTRSRSGSMVGVQEVACELLCLAVEHRTLYDQLTYRSQHDSLTELPNREWLEAQLQKVIEEAKPRDEMVALAFIDLDGFKQVNDEHGHRTGDQYLRHVVRSFQGVLRGNEILARWGGDEFILVSPGWRTRDESTAIGQRLADALEQSFCLNGVRFVASASIGIAVFPEDDETPDGLRQKADQAMYSAKVSGRDPIRVYNRADYEGRETDLVSASDLREALADGHFRLYYQPQFALDGRLFGCEALLRLQHPHHGLMNPGGFIALAERSKLMVPIGKWILQEACFQGRDWAIAANRGVRISVNVSALQFSDPDFAEAVMETLHVTGMAAEMLELEITESVLLKDVTGSIKQMQRLRQAGVRFAIDDFGKGYSSLGYVHMLPIDTIKIDSSFIEGLHRAPSSLPVMRSILSLSANLGTVTIAEGVEDLSDIPLLRELGCDAVQGFGFGKPMPAEQFAANLSKWLRASEKTSGNPVSKKDRTRHDLTALAQHTSAENERTEVPQ